jgi:hypothetical protein
MLINIVKAMITNKIIRLMGNISKEYVNDTVIICS